jgi:dipeptidyl aminopeptidase/acylaminoacyl peptidase
MTLSALRHARRLTMGAVVAPLVLWSLPALASNGLTAHDIARLRGATAVAVSPDGATIAYVLTVPRRPLADEDGAAWQELHVVSADGVPVPFVSGKENVSGVRFTPDGRALSFLAKRAGDTTRSLYVMPLGGGEARRVMAHETDLLSYAWNPAGDAVAFTATDAVPAARQDLEKKGFNQEVYEETVQFVRVWVDVLEDSRPAVQLALEGSASSLAWSPVDDRLAVVLAPTPLVDDSYVARRIRVIDATSGRSISSVAHAGKLGELVWSPDGQWLAFVAGENLNDPAPGRLLVAPATGGAPRELLPGYAGHVSAIRWRGADTIAYIGDEGTETVVSEVGIDGRRRRVIVPAGGRVLTSLDVSRDGQTFAFLGDTWAHPSEVFRLRAADPVPVRVTHSNPWLDDARLAKQDVVTFKARDGLELEGILIRPLDEQPGQRYPLILTVHGGPEAHDRNGWKTNYANLGQVAAAQGFAVFYPNYRGSTGRGVAFSKTSQGDPAGKEFDDLVDAVDHLVAIGLVDRSKVGVTGGSYGGYATAWLSTYYTDRFAAGVMFVGLSNKISALGTTDIPMEEYHVHARKRPWDDWQFFLERSPIYHAAQSKTPLLILGGAEDPRVDPSQSLEMYRYLKLHGKTVRLVRYPGEQHGNRRAAARLDYSLRLLRWMEHYLQGPGGTPPAPDLDYADPREALSGTR